MTQTVYVLNGPNMNLLGTREPEKYGRSTLADVEKLCRTTAGRFGLEVEFRQSNHEGQLVDWIQEAQAKKAAGTHSQSGGLHHHLDSHSRCAPGGQHAGDRNPRHQHPCP